MSLLTFALAWPIMVVPTYVVVRGGGSIYWAWGFAAAYIVAMADLFLFAVPIRPVEDHARDRGGSGEVSRLAGKRPDL